MKATKSGLVQSLLSRCAAVFRRQRLNEDLDEELRAHIDFAIEDNLRSGLPEREARRAAMLAFGGVSQTKERYRVQRELPWIETLLQDVRYALRQLRKSPGFAVTAMLTLALGIGSVTAVFSVVSAVLLHPYDFRDPGQIVIWRESIREIQSVSPLLPDNYLHYLNLKDHAQSIQDAAIMQSPVFSISTGTDHPRMTEGLAVSPNFFSVLGVNPLLGRSFLQEEAQRGKDKEVMLTWGAWQRLYHGNPSVLGMTLRVGDEAQTIVGVLPQTFRFPVISMVPGGATYGSTERYEIFKPLVPLQAELTANDSEFNYLVVARLKPGVSVQQAESELDGIEKATAAADHLAIHLGVVVQPFAQEITGNVRKPLWLLLAAVLGVLLMACVNLANLQIARGVARDPETALRSALGAGRARLLQAVLIENLLLGLAGGLGGVAFAVVAEKLLLMTAASLPRLNEVHLSTPMLLFALALSILTSLGFGLLPALRSLRVLPRNALQSSSTRLSSDKRAIRSRRVLVAIEVACSVTLLIVTALITRSFSHLLTQDRQFNAQHVVLARTDLSEPRYLTSETSLENLGTDPGSLARGAMIDRTLDRLHSMPGVQSVALTNVIPLTGEMSTISLVRPDHPVPAGQEPVANRRFISPGYFAAMEIPLISGRDFIQQDRGNRRALILSDKTAKAVFPGENPLGRTIQHWGHVYTVIGITADARINDLKRNAPVFYLPYWDFPPENPVFLVRSEQGIQALGPAMRQAIWSIDPDISIPTVISLATQLNDSVATERFQTAILSSFGGAALLLALLGIYGVLTYSVSLRTQEFGIRIALGSSRAKLARLVLKDASSSVLGGIALGLLGAAAATRWVGSILYETSTMDPWAIGLSLTLLLLAALLASLIPLRKATSVNPISVLRAD